MLFSSVAWLDGTFFGCSIELEEVEVEATGSFAEEEAGAGPRLESRTELRMVTLSLPI